MAEKTAALRAAVFSLSPENQKGDSQQPPHQGEGQGERAEQNFWRNHLWLLQRTSFGDGPGFQKVMFENKIMHHIHEISALKGIV